MFNPLVLGLLFGALLQVADSNCIDCGFFPHGYCDKTLNECVYRKGQCQPFDDWQCTKDPKCECRLEGCICKLA